MKYIVRLNLKALHPVTKKLIVSRTWEVEQCANRDSEKVIWHCEDVRIDKTPIRELFKLPEKGQRPWQTEVWGFCVRGQDNVVEIHTGPQDASGNR